MRCEGKRSDLLPALVAAARVAPVRAVRPVLSAALLEARGDAELVVRATDLERTLEFAAPAGVVERGKVAVPARLLAEAVRAAPDGPLSLWGDGAELRVVWPGGRLALRGYEPSEMPAWPEWPGGGVRLRRDAFAAFVSGTAFAAARDSGKPISGVWLELGESGVVGVATDGYRMALGWLGEVEEGGGEARRALVPAAGLEEAARVVGDGDGECEVAASGSRFAVRAGDVMLTARMLDGLYPDVRSAVPRESESVVLVGRDEFVGALERMALVVAEDGLHPVRVVWSGGEVMLRAENGDVGEGEERMAASTDGPSGEVVLNARHLLDCVKNLGGPEVAVGVSGQVVRVWSPSSAASGEGSLSDLVRFEYYLTSMRAE